MPHGVEIR